MKNRVNSQLQWSHVVVLMILGLSLALSAYGWIDYKLETEAFLAQQHTEFLRLSIESKKTELEKNKTIAELNDQLSTLKNPLAFIESEVIHWITNKEIHSPKATPKLAHNIVELCKKTPNPLFMLALGSAESAFDPKAKSGKSCIGIWMINPTNLPDLQKHGIAKTEGDLYKVDKNLKASVHILYRDGTAPMDVLLNRYLGADSSKYRAMVVSRLGYLWGLYYKKMERLSPPKVVTTLGTNPSLLAAINPLLHVD